MTEREELLDLYIDDALPEALRANVEAYLASHPNAAADAAALQATITRLKSTTTDRPDSWFVERTLDRLLNEHAAAQEPDLEQTFSRRK